MAAITSLALSTAVPLGRALAAVGRRIARHFGQIARLLKNRRDASRLAVLDDRMLADIGLTRGDLRDAFAEPVWRDPTNVLAHRAAERRLNRPRAIADCVSAMAFASPFGAAPPIPCYPPVDRPAHNAM
jgi:uncharacterized protein YjiS (DUF1127 family)